MVKEKFMPEDRLLRSLGRNSPLEVGGGGPFVVSYWEAKGKKEGRLVLFQKQKKSQPLLRASYIPGI